nr:RHS repeat-associated core domain-containing protein [Citrobacter portucalensis]
MVYVCHNGMPQALTDEEGKLHWRQDVETWGETRSEYADEEGGRWRKIWGGAPEENLRFAGQYLDRETGLHYNTFRYYAPDMGRFITPDPIGLLGGLNLYAYAPNPLGWIDPLGLKCGDTTRVRHYTNRKGSNAISESGVIKAHDNGRVYLEPANKKPLSQIDVEAKYQIGRGKGRDYVETDVPNEQLEWITNPRYHVDELTVKDDIILSDNAKITRRK